MPYEFTAFVGTAHERILVQVERESRDFNLHERAAIELLAPRMLGVLGRAKKQHVDHVARADSLSRREIQILEQVATGATNAAIADSLGISPRTVQTHLAKTFEKLGTRSRAAAVAIFLRGVSPDELVVDSTPPIDRYKSGGVIERGKVTEIR